MARNVSWIEFHAVYLVGLLLFELGCLVGIGQAFAGLGERERDKSQPIVGLAVNGLLAVVFLVVTGFMLIVTS